MVCDLLGCIYAMLRGEYLMFCSGVYGGAPSWQEKEAALFAIRSAHDMHSPAKLSLQAEVACCLCQLADRLLEAVCFCLWKLRRRPW